MSSTETFCLKWNDYDANMSSAFRQLREDKVFFDVTLSVESGDIQASERLGGILATNTNSGSQGHPLCLLSFLP